VLTAGDGMTIFDYLAIGILFLLILSAVVWVLPRR
jgi:hypothetical protein